MGGKNKHLSFFLLKIFQIDENLSKEAAEVHKLTSHSSTFTHFSVNAFGVFYFAITFSKSSSIRLFFFNPAKLQSHVQALIG